MATDSESSELIAAVPVMSDADSEVEGTADSACCSRKCYARTAATAMPTITELLPHVLFGHSILELFAGDDA
jgi:hypothetical protein